MKHLGVAVLLFSSVACGDSGGGGTTGAGGSGDGGAAGTTTSSSAGGGGVGGSAATTSCELICEKNQAIDDVILCGWDGSTCVADCDAAFSALDPMCVDEAEAYNDCLIAQPPEDFACNGDGSSTLSTTTCQADADALVLCTG